MLISWFDCLLTELCLSTLVISLLGKMNGFFFYHKFAAVEIFFIFIKKKQEKLSKKQTLFSCILFLMQFFLFSWNISVNN